MLDNRVAWMLRPVHEVGACDKQQPRCEGAGALEGTGWVRSLDMWHQLSPRVGAYPPLQSGITCHRPSASV